MCQSVCQAVRLELRGARPCSILPSPWLLMDHTGARKAESSFDNMAFSADLMTAW